ncbi:HAD-IA family hydrolase [Kribbella speibonae]|uniref:HAD family hydrolase n=1 Tax=Kribbella speibonae TaxID=1572660 RepID=A0A4R0IZP4_9ACTN|nr:HAD-IA family hydrolase [Kribbella speibonae]TCC22030.1 HAD family hydrolase [Kribbella speibonae]TCC34315.1 HAD family hydrolase [Kribbella speibonae]
MEIRDIRAVLFDMDGTLVDSDAVVDRSWGRWATEYGLVPADVLAVAHGNPAMATVTHFLPDASAAERTAAWARVFDLEVNDVDGVVAKPGALDLLGTLGRIGVPWAVYTSAPAQLAKVRLTAAGIAPSVLVTVDDVSRGKPDPEGYLRAAELLGVPVTECLVVEDTVVGLTAGQTSGALTAGLKGIAADIELADLHRLDALFKGLE